MEGTNCCLSLSIDCDVGLYHGGLDKAWTQAVAVDSIGGVIYGNLLGHSHDSVLRCHIDRCAGESNEAQHGRRVDDPSAGVVTSLVGRMRILGEELLQGVLAAKEDTAGVDGNRLIEETHVCLVQAMRLVPVGCFGGYARVVHHDVEPTTPLHGLGDEILDLFLGGNIALDEHGSVLSVTCLEELDGRLLFRFYGSARRGDYVGTDDSSSLARVSHSDGTPETRRGSRDDGDFVLELARHDGGSVAAFENSLEASSAISVFTV